MPRPPSLGISGRNALEWVAAFPWNQWPLSLGMGGRIDSEYAECSKKEALFQMAVQQPTGTWS